MQERGKTLCLPSSVKSPSLHNDLAQRLCSLQERDKLSVAAEGATSLRIKTQEILAKEEQVRALLASNKLKLDNLLGTRGKGGTHSAEASNNRSFHSMERRKWKNIVHLQLMLDMLDGTTSISHFLCNFTLCVECRPRFSSCKRCSKRQT